MKLMQDGYAKHGEVFTVPVALKRITFLIGPDVAPHFFKASDDEMSQTEVSCPCMHAFCTRTRATPCTCNSSPTPSYRCARCMQLPLRACHWVAGAHSGSCVPWAPAAPAPMRRALPARSPWTANAHDGPPLRRPSHRCTPSTCPPLGRAWCMTWTRRSARSSSAGSLRR